MNRRVVEPVLSRDCPIIAMLRQRENTLLSLMASTLLRVAFTRIRIKSFFFSFLVRKEAMSFLRITVEVF